jgi:hypothetical protein
MIVIFLTAHYFKTDAELCLPQQAEVVQGVTGAVRRPLKAAAELPKMSTPVHTLDVLPPSGVSSVG